MANVDIVFPPTPSMASTLQPQSSFVDSHTLIVSPAALSVIETCNLILAVYEVAWQTIYTLKTSHKKLLGINMETPSSNSSLNVAGKQRGPPQPDPEPAAPPIIILSQCSNARAPHFQVLDPVDQGLVESGPSTSSLLQPQEQLQQQNTSRYHFTSRSTHAGTCSRRPPSKPEPEPNPHPAPPVIILSTDRRSTTPSPPPPIPTSSPSPPPLHPSQLPPTDSTSPPAAIMGSKFSKENNSETKGAKLQPSQQRQDKEEMKEPSNYYTHRSKSMRRKADQSTGSSAAAAAGGNGRGSS